MVYPPLLPLMRTPWLPVVDWTDAPADLNGLVRFAERRNLVSARVPSHFKRSLPLSTFQKIIPPLRISLPSLIPRGERSDGTVGHNPEHCANASISSVTSTSPFEALKNQWNYSKPCKDGHACTLNTSHSCPHFYGTGILLILNMVITP